ncbi:BA75_00962T0 [Komagataella pastoris]|uniref:BA75_00962T0 n=1 Tax=Komagataella pastoris TaxID=4922 RepID=A0A1B2J9F7_PICPA|nr:BA75_00962T0 [Komagataella pastoris]
MASAIYILDIWHNLLISRKYKQDLDDSLILSNYVSQKKSQPIFHYQGCNYISYKADDIIILMISFSNINCVSNLYFCHQFANALKEYLDGRLLDDSSIKENFILVYQLFDETFDFGIPQLTDFNILREYIKLSDQDSELETSNVDSKSKSSQKIDTTNSNLLNTSISRTATTNLSWRPKGIFYPKNEFFVNLVESLNLLYLLETKKLQRNFISGQVTCQCYLSGMPRLVIALNIAKDDSLFDNVNYHQCINSDEQDSKQSKVITFTPPDGKFTLFTYQILQRSLHLKPLVLVEPIYKLFCKKNSYRLRITASLTTHFKRNLSLNDLKICIPIIINQTKSQLSSSSTQLLVDYNVPPKFKCKLGNAKVNLETNRIIWEIHSLPGNVTNNPNVDDFKLTCEFQLIDRHSLLGQLHELSSVDKQNQNSIFYLSIQTEEKRLNDRLDEDTEISDLRNPNALISLSFQLPLMAYSGIMVEYLKITEDQFPYQTFPWVKYLTKTDNYHLKLGHNNFINNINDEHLTKAIEETGSSTTVTVVDTSNDRLNQVPPDTASPPQRKYSFDEYHID